MRDKKISNQGEIESQTTAEEMRAADEGLAQIQLRSLGIRIDSDADTDQIQISKFFGLYRGPNFTKIFCEKLIKGKKFEI